MKKRTKLILGCLILFVAFIACGESSTPASNASNARSSSSGGNLSTVCNKDADGNPIQFKRACQMIVWRYSVFADENAYGYFYGFVQGVPGPVIEYVVQGGVFPVSDLVNSSNYVVPCGTNCGVPIEKQQPDGTYGTNGDALFGKRADGAYFEWLGPYAFSEQPLSFTGQKVEGCKTGVPGC